MDYQEHQAYQAHPQPATGRLSWNRRNVPAPLLYQEIAENIRRRIRAGVLKPGDELPSRAALAAEFEASETPVRKALELLDREGWIVLRAGRLAVVAAEPPTG